MYQVHTTSFFGAYTCNSVEGCTFLNIGWLQCISRPISSLLCNQTSDPVCAPNTAVKILDINSADKVGFQCTSQTVILSDQNIRKTGAEVVCCDLT